MVSNRFAGNELPEKIRFRQLSIERESSDPFALPSQYHWTLANPCLLEPPIEARGQLGLWDVYLPIHHIQE